MEWYLKVAQPYEEFDARINVADIVQLYKDGVTLYFTTTRKYLEGTEENPPPRLSEVPEELRSRLDQIKTSNGQKVSGLLSPIKTQGAQAPNIRNKTVLTSKVSQRPSKKSSNRTISDTYPEIVRKSSRFLKSIRRTRKI